MLERYGVGRGTLREALRHLELQGVLQIRPGPTGGPMVAMPGPSNLASSITLLLALSRTPFREVVDVAGALEPAMAQLAAEQADDDAIAALRGSVDHLVEHLRAKDTVAFMREHQHFHELLAAATGNELFRYLSGALQNIISGSQTGVVYSLAQMKITVQAHEAIVDAIADRDGPRARAAIAEHMGAWRKMLHRQHADALDRAVTWGEGET